MKRKLISALCIMAVILSLLTACQKPDNGEGNADNGGAGDNGIVGDNDNTSKPRESITSLHYTGEGQKTDFGYRYSTEIEIGGGSSGHNYYPQGTGYSAHIDYKTDYSYYPVNDVKLNVFHGTNSTYLELHRLCVVGPDLKFQYLTEPDDMYHNDKYSITIETTDYSDTEHFCHYVYSYSEEVTIPAEFFEGDRGVIELYACAINGAPSYPDKTMRKVSDPAKLYYRRYNDTVRISSSELSLTESVITKESDVERSALSKEKLKLFRW